MINRLGLMGVCLMLLSLCACNWNSDKSTQPNESIVIRESELEEEDSVFIEPDSVLNGPFVKTIDFYKNDFDGGAERYELDMNLYDANLEDGRGLFCHGVLRLYVKSPDGKELVEVAHRIINKVYSIEGNEAKLLMDNGSEIPLSFEATITYNPTNGVYDLKMAADPMLIDDLIENNLQLQ